jgi:hypothetical protein
MIRLKIIIPILLLIPLCLPMKLLAQIEEVAPGMASGLPVPGYVILSNGDTLFGKIRWTLKYVENNPVEVKFIAENGESKFLNASEIKGFGNRQKVWEEGNIRPVFLAPEDYVSLPSFKKGIPVFMNRLIIGRLTVYQNRSSAIITTTKSEQNTRIDGIGFFFTPGEGLSIGPTYRTDYRIIESRTRFSSYFVSREGGAIIKVDKENYDDLYNTLFSDCPAIGQEIDKNPDLKKFKNFMILAEVYNQVCR